MKKIMFAFLFLTSSILLLSSKMTTKAAEVNLDEKCQQVVNFLSENITEFRNEYNASHEDKLNVTSFEGYTLVYVIDYDTYGVYIDFNDNNGYILTSFDYEIFDLQTSGDLEYMKNVSFSSYHTVDGFIVDNGTTYSHYEENENQEDVKYGYNGQVGNGDAYIYDIDKYIADRYPSYTYEATVDAADNYYYMTSTQIENSYYVHRISDDGGKNYGLYSSNNCAINAVFNVMSLWQLNGFLPNLPAKNVYIDMSKEIVNDKFYQEFGTGYGGPGITEYWTTNDEVNLKYTHELYYQSRYYMVNYENWRPDDGITAVQAENMIGWNGGYYERKVLRTDIVKTFSSTLEFLDAGYAVWAGIRNGDSYGNNHAVTLIGYKRYTYKDGWWIFAQTKTAYFFLVDDGIVNNYTYFDPNANSRVSYEFIVWSLDNY